MSDDNIIVLIFAVCILGPCGAIGAVVFASINALGRNPNAAPRILTSMTISLLIAGVMAVTGLLLLFRFFAP